MILVDSREHKFLNVYPDYRSKQLIIGDFLIIDGNGLQYIIERKTLQDFASSIKTNRIQNQIYKMLALSKSTGSSVVIIIETDYIPNLSDIVEKTNQNIKRYTLYSDIVKFLLIYQLKYGIISMYSKNIYETKKYLEILNSNKLKPAFNNFGIYDVIIIEKTAEYIAYNIWKYILHPGKFSRSFKCKNYCIMDVLENDDIVKKKINKHDIIKKILYHIDCDALDEYNKENSISKLKKNHVKKLKNILYWKPNMNFKN